MAAPQGSIALAPISQYASSHVRLSKQPTQHSEQFSTQIYAKVERKKLAQVATATLSGLTEYLRTQTQPIAADWAKARLRSLQEVSTFGVGSLQ